MIENLKKIALMMIFIVAAFGKVDIKIKLHKNQNILLSTSSNTEGVNEYSTRKNELDDSHKRFLGKNENLPKKSKTNPTTPGTDKLNLKTEELIKAQTHKTFMSKKSLLSPDDNKSSKNIMSQSVLTGFKIEPPSISKKKFKISLSVKLSNLELTKSISRFDESLHSEKSFSQQDVSKTKSMKREISGSNSFKSLNSVTNLQTQNSNIFKSYSSVETVFDEEKQSLLEIEQSLNGNQKNFKSKLSESQTQSIIETVEKFTNEIKDVSAKETLPNFSLEETQLDFSHVCKKVEMASVSEWFEKFVARKFLKEASTTAAAYAQYFNDKFSAHRTILSKYVGILRGIDNNFQDVPYVYMSIRISSLISYILNLFQDALSVEIPQQNFNPKKDDPSFNFLIEEQIIDLNNLEIIAKQFQLELNFIKSNQKIDGSKLYQFFMQSYSLHIKSMEKATKSLCEILNFIVLLFSNDQKYDSLFKKILFIENETNNEEVQDEKIQNREFLELFFEKFSYLLNLKQTFWTEEDSKSEYQCQKLGLDSVHAIVLKSWIGFDTSSEFKAIEFFTKNFFEEELKLCGDKIGELIKFDAFVIVFKTENGLLEDIFIKTQFKFAFHIEFFDNFAEIEIFVTIPPDLLKGLNTHTLISEHLKKNFEIDNDDLQKITLHQKFYLVLYRLYVKLRVENIIKLEMTITEVYDAMYDFVTTLESDKFTLFDEYLSLDQFKVLYFHIITFLCKKRTGNCDKLTPTEQKNFKTSSSFIEKAQRRSIVPPLQILQIFKEAKNDDEINNFFSFLEKLSSKKTGCSLLNDPFVIPPSTIVGQTKSYFYTKACTKDDYEKFVKFMVIILKGIKKENIPNFYLSYSQKLVEIRPQQTKYALYLMTRYIKSIKTSLEAKEKITDNTKAFVIYYFNILEEKVISSVDITKSSGFYGWNLAVFGAENSRLKSFTEFKTEREYLKTDLYYIVYQANLKVQNKNDPIEEMIDTMPSLFQNINNLGGTSNDFDNFRTQILECRSQKYVLKDFIMESSECSNNPDCQVYTNDFSSCDINFIVSHLIRLITINILIDTIYLFDLFNVFTKDVQKLSSELTLSKAFPARTLKSFVQVYHHIFLIRLSQDNFVDNAGFHVLYRTRVCMFVNNIFEPVKNTNLFDEQDQICLIPNKHYAEIQWIVRYFVNKKVPEEVKSLIIADDKTYPAMYGPFFSLAIKYDTIMQDVSYECSEEINQRKNSNYCKLFNLSRYLFQIVEDKGKDLISFFEGNEKLKEIFGLNNQSVGPFTEMRIILYSGFDTIAFITKHNGQEIDRLKSVLRASDYFSNMNNMFEVDDETILKSAFLMAPYSTKNKEFSSDMEALSQYFYMSYSKNFKANNDNNFNMLLQNIMLHEIENEASKKSTDIFNKLTSYMNHKTILFLKAFFEAGTTKEEFYFLTKKILNEGYYLEMVTLDAYDSIMKKIKNQFNENYGDHDLKFLKSNLSTAIENLLNILEIQYMDEETLNLLNIKSLEGNLENDDLEESDEGNSSIIQLDEDDPEDMMFQQMQTDFEKEKTLFEKVIPKLTMEVVKTTEQFEIFEQHSERFVVEENLIFETTHKKKKKSISYTDSMSGSYSFSEEKRIQSPNDKEEFSDEKLKTNYFSTSKICRLNLKKSLTSKSTSVLLTNSVQESTQQKNLRHSTESVIQNISAKQEMEANLSNSLSNFGSLSKSKSNLQSKMNSQIFQEFSEKSKNDLGVGQKLNYDIFAFRQRRNSNN